MTQPALYHGREQTLVKHVILRRYLERFAHIIGSGWNTITYVDGFSGPWQCQSEALQDTSFAIALEELRKARRTHADRGKGIGLRCMFLERDPAAYARLRAFADAVTDVEVHTQNREFAAAIPDILDFVRSGGPSSFPFFFIDPTGWTGFEMNQIAPLLRQRPGEVLINFMTDFIRRFIDHPDQQTAEQFAALFGSEGVQERVQAMEAPQDREDTLISTYAANVRTTGGFSHTCAAAVLYPEIDRRFFHLIYATRDRKGLEVFKKVEQQAMEVQEQTRAELKQRTRVRRSRQPELFSALDMDNSHSIERLRNRYLDRAEQAVRAVLQTQRTVLCEVAWDLALSFPLVWECDLKAWLRSWQAEGALRIDGMEAGQRVPKREGNNVLVWQGLFG
jgi:three-Cys-motif partner protein